MAKRETELRNFFLWFGNGYSMIYGNVGGIKDPLKQDLPLEFCRKKTKDIRILTETHISYTSSSTYKK